MNYSTESIFSSRSDQWLDMHFQRLKELDIFDGKSPNHALVNEYLPGQGIMVSATMHCSDLVQIPMEGVFH